MLLFHVFSLRFVGSSLRIKVLIYHCEKNYTCIRNQFLSADVTAPYLNHTFRPLTNQQLVNQSVPRTHTHSHTHTHTHTKNIQVLPWLHPENRMDAFGRQVCVCVCVCVCV